MEQTMFVHPAADTEWTPLPTTEVEQLRDTNRRQHLPYSNDGNYKTITSTEELAAPGNESSQQEENGAEITRKKKMRLEKGGEGVHERKRSRTRHATKNKEKL
jgi:hypothetical protein